MALQLEVTVIRGLSAPLTPAINSADDDRQNSATDDGSYNLAEDGADVEAPNAGIKILDNSGTDNTAICSGDKVSRVDIVALRE
jgi:hypothetical protein